MNTNEHEFWRLGKEGGLWYCLGQSYDQYHDAREGDDYVAFTHRWADAAIRVDEADGVSVSDDRR